MKEKKLGRNIVFNILKTMCSVIFPLITIPYISRALHAENVGKINFGNSIVSYIGLIASLGISTYAVRECSRDREDKEKLENVTSQLFSINVIFTFFAYIVLVFLLMFWKSIFEYRELIVIQSMTIFFTTLGADWLNTAMEDFEYLAIRTFIAQLLSLCMMFIFVHKADDYLKYALLCVIAQSGANISNVLYRRKYCKVKFTFHINWKKHMPPIMILFSMILAQQIFVNVDITMLGVMRSDYEVGLYSTATKIYLIVNQIIASIAWVVMPQMSLLYSKKNYSEINKLLRYTINIICVLGIPAVIGLCIFSKEILSVIAGEEYISASGSLSILSIALAFSLVGGLVGNIILLPSGREKICLLSCIISAGVNFALNIILIPRYGIIAAALTTAISQLITLFIGVMYIEKEIKFDYWRKLMRAPIVEGILIICIGLLCKMFFLNSFIKLFFGIIISLIIYVPILLITKDELAVSWKNKIVGKFVK